MTSFITDPFARGVEAQDGALGVTLWVNGVMIAGTLVPVRHFYQWAVEGPGRAADATEGDVMLDTAAVGDAFSRIEYGDEAVRRLCLKDAHVQAERGAWVSYPYMLIDAAAVGALSLGVPTMDPGPDDVAEDSSHRLEDREVSLAEARQLLRDNLDGTSPPQERIRLIQQSRNARVLRDPEGFFLLVVELERLTSGRLDDEFAERFEQLVEDTGYDLEEVLTDETPEAVRAYHRERDAAERALLIAACREFGESELARLLEEDEAEFDRRRESGRRAVGGK